MNSGLIITGMSGCGGMADAKDSKSFGGDFVWVRVPPSAWEELQGIYLQLFLYSDGIGDVL